MNTNTASNYDYITLTASWVGSVGRRVTPCQVEPAHVTANLQKRSRMFLRRAKAA